MEKWLRIAGTLVAGPPRLLGCRGEVEAWRRGLGAQGREKPPPHQHWLSGRGLSAHSFHQQR